MASCLSQQGTAYCANLFKIFNLATPSASTNLYLPTCMVADAVWSQDKYKRHTCSTTLGPATQGLRKNDYKILIPKVPHGLDVMVVVNGFNKNGNYEQNT